LEKELNFIPSYRFHSSDDSEDLTKAMQKNCYSKGFYCIGNENEMLKNPTDFIDEALRQICMFKLDQHPQKLDWFYYINRYKEICLKNLYPKLDLEKDCYNKIWAERVRAFEFYKTPIEKCVKDSWIENDQKIVNKATQFNTLLAESLPEDTYRNLVPSVMINDFMYRGDLDAFAVATSICDSFDSPREGCVHMKIKAKNEL